MKLHIIETGKFKLDGGAMFGVVPCKRMWNRLNPADSDNLCTWQMRCLLVEDGDRRILIDTGVGSKQDEKFPSHFYPDDTVTFEDSRCRGIDGNNYSNNNVVLNNRNFTKQNNLILASNIDLLELV